MSKQDLIDLAIEYSMIRSIWEFNQRNQKQQEAILRTIKKVAEAGR